MSDLYPATRTDALARLKNFVPHAGRDYATRRNFDLGAGNHTAVSTLSPYVRCRLLTETEVLQAVLARHSASSAEKFVQEVFWRTYWKGWLEMRPGVWDQYQSALHKSWNDVQTQSGLRQRWENACLGQTDIECFNIWAQDLVNTGYLHNHARMWFASIWIFTLKLPWELGADFFLRHLLDGDPASNTLSWRWVAGIQTLGKTYLARTSNISKFTEGRFHPKWQLASEALPISSPTVPDPVPIPILPTPDASLRTGFLLHEDDLSPGYALQNLNCVASAVLAPQTSFSPLETAPKVAAFRTAAQRDVVARWSDRLPLPALIDDLSNFHSWCSDNHIEQVVTPYAPVGPVAHFLSKASNQDGAPKFVQVRRPYDEVCWPYATKGFFAFKKNIPKFLRQFELAPEKTA